jgi:ribosomal protein S10
MTNTRHLRVAKNDISGLWEFRVDSRLISAHETYSGAEDRLYSYDTMYSVRNIKTEIVLDTRGI